MSPQATSSAILILSHLMDAQGNPGIETQARVNKALSLWASGSFNLIITSGWAYRQDSDLKIGEVVAEYLISAHGVPEDQVLADVDSRDTVGDAYFIRENIVKPYGITHLTVVTSQYHVERTEAIFKRFYPQLDSLEVVGSPVEVDDLAKTQAHEQASITAFNETFEGVDFSSGEAVRQALRERHPFYNGQVHEKI